MKHIIKPQLLFLLSENIDPYQAMAADEYFLNQAEAGKIDAFCRLYTIEPPAITVGYFFKKKHLLLDKIKNDRVRVVRRITGGNAVFHADDLTYSFICRKGINAIGDNKSLYLFMARILQKALEKARISCTINTTTGISSGLNTPHCFGSVSQYEICGEGGRKVIGSAQKILSASCIQQGSIFYNYNSSMLLPYLKGTFKPSAPEETREIDNGPRALIRQEIKAGLKEYFEIKEYVPNASDLKGIKELVEKKYAVDTWNYAR